VAVNCSAVPEALLESEPVLVMPRGLIPGRIRGADRAIEIPSARWERVLLDEIWGDCPLHLQPKLLLVCKNGRRAAVGENRQTSRVDIRVIATPTRSLAALVREGLFRADLYYRLM